MTTRKTRVPPLPRAQWGSSEKAAFKAFIAAMVKDPQPDTPKQDRDMSALELFLNHPQLAAAYLPYSAWLLQQTEMGIRERELLILRVAWLRLAEYEWAQHVLIAQAAGIPDADIRRVGVGADAPGWCEQDRLLLRAVDELIESAFLSDTSWRGLAGHLDTHQIMELLFIVGTYDMLGMVFNSLGIPLNETMKSALASFPLR